MPTPDPRVRRRGIAGFFEALFEARGLARPADRPAGEYKEETRRHWTAVPCGTDVSEAVRHSQEYFADIERYRYRTQPWTAEAIDGFDLDGRRVLEIGFGAGTDHLRLARRGSWLVGVDLTPQNFVETQRRFELEGRHPRLAVADMESLPFRDRTFDRVYSLGAIHHTPDVRRTVCEIARVLAPGGRAWVAVYHRNSVFFWWSVYLYRFLLRGGWRRRTLRAQLSLVERPNTNEGLVVLLHAKREVETLFRTAGFDSVRTHVRHLVPGDIVGLDVLLKEPERPRRLLDWVGKLWGWYVIVDAAVAPPGSPSRPAV
ncbi:MAG: class I SAM-dependent methyltransferase [Burkholderiales bacterium]|jgi:ubiquinone/menaquinone biosynthesis C-methylase UbiE